MGRLFDEIRSAVVAERYVVGDHAARQLDRRRIESWQIAAEIDVAAPLTERPHSLPTRRYQTLADGTPGEGRLVAARRVRRREARHGTLLRQVTMLLPGKRVRRQRTVWTDRFAVVLDAEAVIPDADPSEACFEPHVEKFIREVRERANAGYVEWLKRHGKVYEAVGAA